MKRGADAAHNDFTGCKNVKLLFHGMFFGVKNHPSPFSEHGFQFSFIGKNDIIRINP